MCWLVDDGATLEGAEARLEALVTTTDGFELAEVDLDLRGEGTIMGERQKGRSDLKLASLRRDREMVGTAREVAFEIVDGPGGIAEQPGLADELRPVRRRRRGRLPAEGLSAGASSARRALRRASSRPPLRSC